MTPEHNIQMGSEEFLSRILAAIDFRQTFKEIIESLEISANLFGMKVRRSIVPRNFDADTIDAVSFSDAFTILNKDKDKTFSIRVVGNDLSHIQYVLLWDHADTRSIIGVFATNHPDMELFSRLNSVDRPLDEYFKIRDTIDDASLIGLTDRFELVRMNLFCEYGEIDIRDSIAVLEKSIAATFPDVSELNIKRVLGFDRDGTYGVSRTGLSVTFKTPTKKVRVEVITIRYDFPLDECDHFLNIDIISNDDKADNEEKANSLVSQLHHEFDKLVKPPTQPPSEVVEISGDLTRTDHTVDEVIETIGERIRKFFNWKTK